MPARIKSTKMVRHIAESQIEKNYHKASLKPRGIRSCSQCSSDDETANVTGISVSMLKFHLSALKNGVADAFAVTYFDTLFPENGSSILRNVNHLVSVINEFLKELT